MNRAFTLVEAVVALAVVALAFGWLVSASYFAREAVKVSALRTQAAALGAELAGKLQRDGLTGASSGTFTDAPGIRWELNMGSVSGDEMIACREARLTVLYPDVGDETGKMEFTFLVPED